MGKVLLALIQGAISTNPPRTRSCNLSRSGVHCRKRPPAGCSEASTGRGHRATPRHAALVSKASLERGRARPFTWYPRLLSCVRRDRVVEL